MKIELYRNHLATELEALPDIRSQVVQSYALTTSVLLRKMAQHLNIKNLCIPDAFDSEQSYDLAMVLNIFIHYITFDPHWRSLPERDFSEKDDNKCDNVIYLYSKDRRKNRRELRISLKTYFDLVSRFAHDDLFVAQHLLHRLITLLSEVVNQPNKDFERSYLVNVSGLIDDSLTLTSKLVQSNAIQVSRDTVVVCYKDASPNPFKGREWVPRRMSCVDLITEFGSLWYPYPFVPSKEEFDGEITYAEGMHQNHDTLMFTFGALLSMFKMIRDECEAASR